MRPLFYLILLLVSGCATNQKFYQSVGKENISIQFNPSQNFINTTYLFVSVFDVDKKNCPSNYLGDVRLENSETIKTHFPIHQNVVFSITVNIPHLFGGFSTYRQGYFRLRPSEGANYLILVEEKERMISKEIFILHKGERTEMESLPLDQCE